MLHSAQMFFLAKCVMYQTIVFTVCYESNNCLYCLSLCSSTAFWIQVGNLSKIIEKINGVARCPYDPRHNSTAVITSQGELYAATVIDFSGRDPAIYRSLGNVPPLRTAQYNSKWLNGKIARRNKSTDTGRTVLGNCSCFIMEIWQDMREGFVARVSGTLRRCKQ